MSRNRPRYWKAGKLGSGVEKAPNQCAARLDEHDNCAEYSKCLAHAARVNAKCLPCVDCPDYVPQPILVDSHPAEGSALARLMTDNDGSRGWEREQQAARKRAYRGNKGPAVSRKFHALEKDS